MVRLCPTWGEYALERPVGFMGPLPNKLLIIAGRPAWNHHGEPLGGGTARLLSQYLHNTNLPGLTSWLVTTMICCPGDESPTIPQIHTCAGHLRPLIKIADPQWIVTLGADGLRSLQCVKDNQLTKAQGRWFHIPAGPFIGRKCWPIFSPKITFRDKTDKYATTIQDSLMTLDKVIHKQIDSSPLEIEVRRGGRFAPQVTITSSRTG